MDKTLCLDLDFKRTSSGLKIKLSSGLKKMIFFADDDGEARE